MSLAEAVYQAIPERGGGDIRVIRHQVNFPNQNAVDEILAGLKRTRRAHRIGTWWMRGPIPQLPDVTAIDDDGEDVPEAPQTPKVPRAQKLAAQRHRMGVLRAQQRKARAERELAKESKRLQMELTAIRCAPPEAFGQATRVQMASDAKKKSARFRWGRLRAIRNADRRLAELSNMGDAAVNRDDRADQGTV